MLIEKTIADRGGTMGDLENEEFRGHGLKGKDSFR